MQTAEKVHSVVITREDARNFSAAFGRVAEAVAPRTAQEIFLDLGKKRKELKELREQLVGHYRTDSRYAQNEELVRQIKEKQKGIIEELKPGIPDLVEKIDLLKTDIASDKQMFSDMVLTKIMKGESVELKDQYEQPCFPMFSVQMRPANR